MLRLLGDVLSRLGMLLFALTGVIVILAVWIWLGPGTSDQWIIPVSTDSPRQSYEQLLIPGLAAAGTFGLGLATFLVGLKFQEKADIRDQKRLEAEERRLAAEERKLAAEERKLAAEAQKLEIDNASRSGAPGTAP